MALTPPHRLDPAKQGKHIPGSRTFIEGRNLLTAPDPQALLDRFAGAGQPINDLLPGQPGARERVESGHVIGEYIAPGGTDFAPMTKGIIVYDRRGRAHIIPVRP